MSSTHLAATIPTPGASPLTVLSERVETRAPGPDELLVRVQHACFTPFDVWASVHNPLGMYKGKIILGENLVGQVEKVGEGVEGFEVGDTVLAFSRSHTDQSYNTFQEYAIVPKFSAGKLPPNVNPRDAVTTPDNLVTAIWALTTGGLGLHLPGIDGSSGPLRVDKDVPILVWGGGTSVGQYAIQVLRHAGYTSIHTTASPHNTTHLSSLGASSVTPYTSSTVVSALLAIHPDTKFAFALDAAGDEENLQTIAQVVREGGKVAAMLPIVKRSKEGGKDLLWETDVKFAKDVEFKGVRTFNYQENEHYKHTLQQITVPRLLESGAIKPNKYRLIGSVGKEGKGEDLAVVVKRGLEELREGKVRGERLVFSFV